MVSARLLSTTVAPVGLAVALAFAVRTEAAEEPGSAVTGGVVVSQPMATLENLGPIVIFLERLPGQTRTASVEPKIEDAVIHEKNARFSPAFAVVVASQGVSMVNDDLIYHNVFSYSRPNDFDLGIYAAGQARRIRLDHPGVVKTYCSIHEKMNGTILVTPTPHFDVVQPGGDFAIERVPAGRYRLTSWCEKLPMTTREIELEAGQTLSLEIDLAASLE